MYVISDHQSLAETTPKSHGPCVDAKRAARFMQPTQSPEMVPRRGPRRRDGYIRRSGKVPGPVQNVHTTTVQEADIHMLSPRSTSRPDCNTPNPVQNDDIPRLYASTHHRIVHVGFVIESFDQSFEDSDIPRPCNHSFLARHAFVVWSINKLISPSSGSAAHCQASPRNLHEGVDVTPVCSGRRPRGGGRAVDLYTRQPLVGTDL